MIKINHIGDFSKTINFLDHLKSKNYEQILKQYGEKGILELYLNTPVDTGRLRDSWYYKYFINEDQIRLVFYNSDIEGGSPVAILVQYGHATNSGAYVEGIDYINPALRDIFNELSMELWKEVVK